MPDAEILKRIDATIEKNLDTTLAWLAKICAQPSVAAQNLGITECADLVAALLREQGFQAEIMPTAGSPVVYGEGGAGAKTLLFYNHYDVQPAEPFDLWNSPPFELTRKGDRLVARGVSDDKGHIITRLAALAAIREVTGGLPLRIKFLIEGEEEIASVHLPEFVEHNAPKFEADACIWETGGVNYEGRPEQVLGMRGICYVELSARTARIDAHSGLGGSIFPNAAWRLVWALSTLKDADENILIPGFYENAHPATERDLALLAALPDETGQMQDTFGLTQGFLKGLTGGVEFERRAVFEPTCTICGLTSGYQGAGAKTVLPAEARAKVDFRLVPDQTPEEILVKLRHHLDLHGFQDIEVKLVGGEKPARTDPDHPFIKLVNDAAREVYGVDPVVSPLSGGSGPVHPFVHVLGLPVAFSGIAYPDNRIHAPNENLLIPHLLKGIKHTAHIVMAFAE